MDRAIRRVFEYWSDQSTSSGNGLLECEVRKACNRTLPRRPRLCTPARAARSIRRAKHRLPSRVSAHSWTRLQFACFAHKPRAAAAPASRREVETVRPRCPNAAAAQACDDGALVVKTTRRACAVRRKHAAAQTAAPRRILRAGDAAAVARCVLQHVIEAKRAFLHFAALVASRPLRAAPQPFPQTDGGTG